MFDLYINKEKVDFKLENEKSLKEVYEHLENWASSEELVVTQILYNEEEWNDNDNIDIKSIKKIELEVTGVDTFSFDVISEIKNYVDRLMISLENKNTYDGVSSLKESVNYLKETLLKLTYIYNRADTSVLENIKDLEIKIFEVESREVALETDSFYEEYKKIVKPIQDKVLFLFYEIYLQLIYSQFKDIDYSPEVIKENRNQIYGLMDQLSFIQTQVATFFQKGDDLSAKKWIGLFAKAFEIFSFIISSIHNSKKISTEEDISKIQIKIQEKLLDLESSLLDNDIISVSDTIEYEFQDSFDEIRNILKQI